MGKLVVLEGFHPITVRQPESDIDSGLAGSVTREMLRCMLNSATEDEDRRWAAQEGSSHHFDPLELFFANDAPQRVIQIDKEI